MDPFSAVSLAGTVVQFVDYASKLISASGELYERWELSSNVKAAESALTIQRLATSAVQDLQDYRIKLQHGADFAHAELATHEAVLRELSRKCNEEATLLIERLDKLKIPENTNHRGWLSLTQALASTWAKKDIERMSQKLLEYQNQINIHVLDSLGKRLDILGIQQSDYFRTMSHENQKMIAALANTQHSLTEDFRDQMKAIGQLIDRATVVVNDNTDQDNRTQKVILDIFRTAGNFSQENKGVMNIIEKEREIRKRVGEDLLESLRFPSITERFEEVAEAHRKTYQWIFKSPNTIIQAGNDKHWDDFPEWLRRDTGLYWLNGKAASGKSTLMNAGFFFWMSGTKEQKSQVGLLRSLLYDILQQNKSLIPVLFPKQWSVRYSAEILSSGSTGNPLNNVWQLSALKLATRTLISQTQIPLKLCLFIDGLDEYEGDETEIADLFGEISKSVNIKCCVSSRPHIPFQDAFSGQPGLRLEDLTFSDIKHYVQDKLADDARMRKLSITEPDEAVKLIEDIVKSANGVFLWVKLVVASLLKGLGNRDQITDLQARLRVIPKKLEDLYMHMILRVDESYQKEASRLYQLVGAAAQARENDWRLVSPLSIFSIAMAEQRDPNLALSAPVPFLNNHEIISLCQKAADRMTSRCGGLLEVQKRGGSRHRISPLLRVSYLHRTVKDCLEKWENQAILKGWTGGSSDTDPYNPNLAILKSYILQLKCIRHDSVHNLMDNEQCIEGTILYARRVETDLCSANVELMDEFFRVALPWIRSRSSSEKVFRPTSSVFTIAVQCGLHLYLRAKLAADGGTPIEKAGQKSLLGYALNPAAGFERFVSAEVVSALLDFGAASPNEILKLTLNYLRTTHSRTATELQDGIVEQLKPWANLVGKLIREDVQLSPDDATYLKCKFSSVPQFSQQIDAALLSRNERMRATRFRDKHKCRQQ